VKLHNDKLKAVMIDNENDRLKGEEPTLFHILEVNKRRTARTIQSVQDSHGFTQISAMGIMRDFANYLRRKYEPIAVDDSCVETKVEAAQPARTSTYEN
jgi:hypothetical protein